MIKVLNLYAGIGGNRKLWEDVEVTAIERNKTIAKIYKDFYPNDEVITTNAHKFLLKYYNKYDFIWSSPPCPTHSKINFLNNIQDNKKLNYPNMMLYEEIIFLKTWFKSKWVIENVKGYYDPFIKPYESENHYFWSNFHIGYRNPIERKIRGEKEEKWGFDLKPYNIPKRFKREILNNMVNPYLALYIFNCGFKEKQITLK